MLYPAIPAGEV